MSGPAEPARKRRPHRMFLVSTELKVQDQLEGTIRLQRGFMCHEQDVSRTRADCLWVKVLDNDSVVKLEKKHLLEVPGELSGLLEPVFDPEDRFKLLANPGRLQQFAALPLEAPLWVQMGQQDELAEAQLRYVGPLTRGSSAVFFGVQLKGSAAGKGVSNGSYKGQRFFSCPDACALFLPASDIRLRHWSGRNGAEARDPAPPRERDPAPPQQQQQHRANGHSNGHPGRGSRPGPPRTRHTSFLQQQRPDGLLAPRAPEPAPAPGAAQAQARHSAPFQVGQRVVLPLEDTLHSGEVRFCGLLPGRGSSGAHVGVLLDAPVGNWDGTHRGEKLCHIPSSSYGFLLPAAKVSPEPKLHRVTTGLHQIRSILKAAPPSYSSKPNPPPPATAGAAAPPKVALIPPRPPPKPGHKPRLTPPPLPPPKPRTSPPLAEQGGSSGAEQGPAPSPLSPDRPPDGSGESEEAWPEGELEVGSMVEVNDPPIYGVICWIGRIGGIAEAVAGIELDQELSAGTDGSYLGERHFRCPANKGLFVKLRNCRRDSRFPAPETPVNQVERCNSIAFAEWGSERVEEHTPPLEAEEARELYRGWKRGIQGHLNSCYLDATLFSLFSCCSSADWVLFWPWDPEAPQDSVEAQDLLRCEIVNPLRRFGYVCASKTMALRRLLEATDSYAGFTNQEKDPEEFLNRLFQLLRVEPLLKIRSMTQQPQQCHLYQLFPPPRPDSPAPPLAAPPTSPPDSPLALPHPLPLPSSNRMRVASVQALLESSFLHAGLKFVEAPSCLLLLMPRFGKDFKMFDAILPSLSLDITDLLDDALRQCSICQAVAEWECVQCYDDVDITPGRLKQFCCTCNTQVHSHRKRSSHAPARVRVPGGAAGASALGVAPRGARQLMSLFSVTCIETSHYVSFVRHGPRADSWLFFDSMADREGGENGFNVPRVTCCPEVGRYLRLTEAELSRVEASSLREPERRLLCDAYMCLYHSPELSLYK